jgi:hypothetical protein
VKEGVEAGVPVELMSAEGKEKHEKMINGEAESHESKENKAPKKVPEPAPAQVEETNDDDVD